jgi:RNA polymerase sigma-70 factor (ECF subfamily)
LGAGDARAAAGTLGGVPLEDLVAAHAGELYRFARSLARSPAEAEDLVQETFLRAVERGGDFRGGAAPATWLHRVLHNLAVDRARRSAREVVVAEVEERWRDDAYTVDAQAVVERAEDRAELEDALVRLPFDHRAVVLLHDVDQMTVKSIADRLGISLPAAKQRLRRGRMMLVSALASGRERHEALQGVPLRCWDARRYVSDYLDDTLQPARRQALEAHLATCPTCPPLYAGLVGARAGLERLRDPDSVVPPGLERRIRATLAEGGTRDARTRERDPSRMPATG